MSETWKDIPGYEGRYQASSLGRIRNVRRGVVLARKPHRDFYAKVNLHRDGKPRTFHVHTLVALAFIGPRPAGMFIDHKNTNHADDSADNLRYVTPHESNMNRQRRGNSRLYTGTRGVYWHGRGGFFARVNRGGKNYRLGSFTNRAAALLAIQEFDAQRTPSATRSKRAAASNC